MMRRTGFLACLLLLGSLGVSAELLYTLEDPSEGQLWYGQTVVVGNGEILVAGGGNSGTGTGIDREFMPSRVFVYDAGSGVLKRTVFDPGQGNDFQFGRCIARWNGQVLISDCMNGAGTIYRYDDVTWDLVGTITSSRGIDGDAFGASMAVIGDTLAIGVPNISVRKRRESIYGVGKVVLFDLVRSRTVKEIASPRVILTQRFGGVLVDMDDRVGVCDRDALWVYDTRGRKKLCLMNPDGPDHRWMSVAWTPGKFVTGSGTMMQWGLDVVRVHDDKTGIELLQLIAENGDSYYGTCVEASNGKAFVSAWSEINRDGVVYEYGLLDGSVCGMIANPGPGYDEFGWPVVAKDGLVVIGGRRVLEDSRVVKVLHVYWD